jgi:magnesium chelatase subunit I
MNLVEKAIRSQFVTYFPNPDALKKKRTSPQQTIENPYRSIISWFDKGNSLNLFFNIRDDERMRELYKVDGLHSLVKKYFKGANEKEAALLMEFVLHGLSSYSLISKKVVEGKVEFKDLMGSMLGSTFSEEEKEDFN